MPPLSKKLGQTRRFLFWETWETHLYLVARTSPSVPGFVPNSRHKWLKGFSRREAATTNFTRCSLTSIVFHGIPAHTPALASLAPECKGCLGTLCKGCHGTEQTARGRGTRPAAR